MCGRASFWEAAWIKESKKKPVRQCKCHCCCWKLLLLLLLLMIRWSSIVMDTPLAISLLQLVISLFVQVSYVIRNKHNFCPARVGIDRGNWRRHPKWKHTFYTTAFAQIAWYKGTSQVVQGRVDWNAMRLTAGLWSGPHSHPQSLVSLQEAIWQHQSDTSPERVFLEATTEVTNTRTTPKPAVPDSWGTKHEAAEAQQLLCGLHSLLWAKSKRQEAPPYFTETLLSLNWFSNSLPTPHRTSLSVIWQIKNILNKTQWEQIFSYLCYPTGDRLKLNK